MKMSNFMLSIVATFAIGAAVGTSTLAVSQQPTSVIQIPAENGAVGGGMTVKLPLNPSRKQADLLAVAYETAKRDGHRYPQLLQGILLQETKAGTMPVYKVAGGEFGLQVNKRYYGVAQLKLSAAKDVLNRYPELWKQFNFQTKTDEEIIAKLIENDYFNIAVASKYLLILQRSGITSPQQLAASYNQGVAGAEEGKGKHYSRAVMEHISNLHGKRS